MKPERRAFTLIELLLAMALLAVVVVFSGAIFQVALNTYRKAGAQTEIMRKLRVITRQIDADFKGLAKEGPIFVGWVQTTDANHFDRIVFFSHGSFQSHEEDPVYGFTARISYMIARRGSDMPHENAIPTRERVLARTQHVLTNTDDPNWPVDMSGWEKQHNHQQQDSAILSAWRNLASNNQRDAYRAMTGINIETRDIEDSYGTDVDDTTHEALADSLNKILCRGVSSFRIEGWYWEDANAPDGVWGPRPEVLMSSGVSDVNGVGFVLYPSSGSVQEAPFGEVALATTADPNSNAWRDRLNPSSFEMIPGLGRALRFTFTLHDSQGIIKPQEYTHIVSLD
ncbi:prepilin-type N-terminal cleavage/methylation domain-containing protein [Planctomycetota bacterium]